MSAVKDPQQGLTFNYSNFYHLYRNGKLQQAESERTLAKGIVLKSHSHTEIPSVAQAQVVTTAQTVELTAWASGANHSAAKHDLAKSLKDLREAHKRLDFLMSEIDEILKRE